MKLCTGVKRGVHAARAAHRRGQRLSQDVVLVELDRQSWRERAPCRDQSLVDLEAIHLVAAAACVELASEVTLA